jgi:phosphate transport system protein
MLKTYEEKVQTIRDEITKIGRAVIEANKASLDALKKNDIQSFKEINVSVKKMVSKSNEIDNLIVTTLALYSPEAKDLRQMVAFLKITNELVRAGSNTKTFLKGFRRSFSEDLNTSAILEYAIPLQKASSNALEITISMIENYDEHTIEENYNRVIVEESKTDDLYAMIEKNILKLISKHLELSKDYFDLLSSFRRLEKTADRAASIANLLLFAQIGGEIEQS